MLHNISSKFFNFFNVFRDSPLKLRHSYNLRSSKSDNLDTVFKIKSSPNSKRYSIVTVMDALQEETDKSEPETPVIKN